MHKSNVDGFSREIRYLRVSVTDRCNLRCFYCVPEEGLECLGHQDILSYEEIVRVVEAGMRLGIRKVRITGGEPLVRKGVVDLISRLSALPGMDDLAMTTNGVLLAPMARPLKEAGLHRVNVSLDSLKPEVFKKITGFDHCERVKAGIGAALDAGLNPVKINVVAVAGLNDGEFADFARLTLERPLSVRFIEYMPIGKNSHWGPENLLSSQALRERLEKEIAPLIPVEKHGPLDGPAKRFAFEGALGEVGFISAISEHFCSQCNRLRLTADGKLRPCLFSDDELDVKEILRGGGKPGDLDEIFREAVRRKPMGLDADRHKKPGCDRGMYSIGG